VSTSGIRPKAYVTTCPCWTKWYSSLQLWGLAVIVKVYGNNIFQGVFKENNLGSKLSLNWHMEFMGFQASFLTPWFPFLPTFPQLLCPYNGFLQNTLSFYYIHFLHPNTNLSIISGILACLIHDITKKTAIKWSTKL
jgi:hypothetical protein